MRKRLLLGGIASAMALTLAPQPASANHLVACNEGFEVICTVIDLTERVVCNPKYLTC